MTANPTRALAVFLLPLTLAACFPYDSVQSQRTVSTARSVAGAWEVIAIDGEPARGNLVIASDEFRLSFCNDMAGGLRIEAGRLVPLLPIRQTERGCINADGSEAISVAWDRRAWEIFRAPLFIRPSGDTMTLHNDAGSIRVRR